MTEVPPVVLAKARSVGVGSRLDVLPVVVAGLERDWSIRVEKPFDDATEASVAEAMRAGGTPGLADAVVGRDAGA